MREQGMPDGHAASIPVFLRSCAHRFGSREAVVFEDRRESFAAIERASAQLALGLLSAGVTKGTRVGILFPNGPDWVIAFFAATRIGALAVPISTFLRPRELAWTLRHADIHTLLSAHRYLNNDYVSLLAEAIPGLTDGEEAPIFVPSAPFLRQVFVWGDVTARFAQPASNLDRLLSSVPSLDDGFLRDAEDGVTAADPLLIVYTSGSTSEPKAVVHSQGAVLRHSLRLAEIRGLHREDRVWLPLPLFWIGGIAFGLLSNMHVGAATVFEERFDPGKTLALLERERISINTGWPHYIKAMQEHPDFSKRDLSGIRVGDARNALHPDSIPADPELRSSPLGMTETIGPHSYEDMSRDLPAELRGSNGMPFEGIELKIVDPLSGEELPAAVDGEICVRGYSTMLGLYKVEREEVFDEDGYYHSGDGGYLEHGRVFFTGRLGDMIKTGGANVTPREIENAIIENAEVMETYVVGVPDEVRGQIVVASAVRRPGHTLTASELRSRLKSVLSAFKLPQAIFFFEEGALPYRANGKIDKPALEALLSERMKSESSS